MTMNTNGPPLIQRLTVRYDRADDRIALFCYFGQQENRLKLELTRALTRRILEHFHARMILECSVAAGYSPSEVCYEIAAIKHARAIQVAIESSSKAPDNLFSQQWPSHRIEKLDISTGSQGSVSIIIQIAKKDQGITPAARLELNASKLHWWLDRLEQLGICADWGMQVHLANKTNDAEGQNCTTSSRHAPDTYH